MEIKQVVCNRCGHDEKIQVISREEALREGKPIYRITCSKCGSSDVRLYD